MSNSIASDHPLTNEQLEALKIIAEKMIPANEVYGVPSGGDERVFAEIKIAATREADILAQGLDELLEACEGNLADQSASVVQALVEGSTVSRFAGTVVTAIVECYYRDSRVMTALGMEPRAPFPQGYDLPDGDWSMLDPVRARGPIWRETS